MPPFTKKSYMRNSLPSSPYGLFGIPVSNSPPTPLDKKSRKAAARKRCQKKLTQAVILAEAPDEPSNSKRKKRTNHPLTSECRVVLHRLELFSLTNGEAQVDENSNPNIRIGSSLAPKRDSTVQSAKRSGRLSKFPQNMEDGLSPSPSSSSTEHERSKFKTPVRCRTKRPLSRRSEPPVSSEDSEDDGALPCPTQSTSDTTLRNDSTPKILGRRKSSKPWGGTSRSKSTSEFLLSSTPVAFGSSADESTFIHHHSQGSALSQRRSLDSINATTFMEHTTSSPKRRKKKMRYSELYMAALRDAKQLRVVAEPMTWLKLTSLILPEYPIDFESVFRMWKMKIVSKLGEGSFSEVYRVRSKKTSGDDFDVLKVIPVGQPGQPSFDEMLPEMSMCLAGHYLKSPEGSYRNRAQSFLSLRGTHLVQGPLTKEMVSAYESFREQKPGETEQKHPAERHRRQFYVVFYTSYDGCELEKELPNLSGDVRASVIMQVVYALAAAELGFEFEHRDLHLSNIVVQDSDVPEFDFRIGGQDFSIKSFGKRAALIDYGMCRLIVEDVLHSPFEPEILVGAGLQRSTYRKQHRLLGGNYLNRCLETNGLWILFLIKKLFPKRPVSSRLFYGAKVNRLFAELSSNHLSARHCVEILEDCRLDETLSILSQS